MTNMFTVWKPYEDNLDTLIIPNEKSVITFYFYFLKKTFQIPSFLSFILKPVFLVNEDVKLEKKINIKINNYLTILRFYLAFTAIKK